MTLPDAHARQDAKAKALRGDELTPGERLTAAVELALNLVCLTFALQHREEQGPKIVVDRLRADLVRVLGLILVCIDDAAGPSNRPPPRCSGPAG